MEKEEKIKDKSAMAPNKAKRVDADSWREVENSLLRVSVREEMKTRGE